MATATRVYPLARAENGQPLAGQPGVPHVVTEFPSKAEAEAFLEGPGAGAFTLNPNHPDRVPEATAATAVEPTADTTPAPAGEEG